MKSIALISHSTDPAITMPVLEQIANALGRQLCEDYAGVWQSQGVPVKAFATEGDAPPDAVLAVVFDSSPQPGILGYHDVSPGGVPYEKVFWAPIRDNGGTLTSGDNSLSVTLSHECLELIEDAPANAWNDMPDGVTEMAHEIGDPVEGDSYPIDGVSVSNFVGPRYFRQGVGPFDFLGIQGDPRGLTAAFQVRPSGYSIKRTGGPAGTTTSVFGETYPEHKKAAKVAPGSRAHKRGQK